MFFSALASSLIIYFWIPLSLPFWSESLLAILTSTLPPQGPVGPASHQEHSPALVRKIPAMRGDLPAFCVCLSSSASDLLLGLPCELKLFCSSGKRDLGAAEKSAFWGEMGKIKKRKTTYSKDCAEEFDSKAGWHYPELGDPSQALRGFCFSSWAPCLPAFPELASVVWLPRCPLVG